MDGSVVPASPGRHIRCWVVWICLGAFLLLQGQADAATVSGVAPHYGSLAGDTQLTVTGWGFSTQFGFDNNLSAGSHVILASNTREFPCLTQTLGCTDTMITCSTPQGMPEDNYYVKVMVDGVIVPDSNLCGGHPTSSNCRFITQSSYTPTIDSLTPHSGRPGDFVTMTGDIITDRYDSIETSSNGKSVSLLRVYVGPQDCVLRENDTTFGLRLHGRWNYGTLTCKTQGTSVGFYNASFIVESPYGRSLADTNLLKVSHTDQIYMYQMYTDITSISPNTGSPHGGLAVTVYGKYLDDRIPYKSAKVFIGDSECEVTEVVPDSHLVCTVAADPGSSDTKFSGNRGVNFEYWTSISESLSDIADVLTLTPSSAGYVSGHLDETWFNDYRPGTR